VGFRTKDVPFAVAPRVTGQTKWSTRALLKYSLRNLLAFSAFPLRLVASSGGVTLTFSGILAAWTLYRYLRGDALTGFTTVILLQLILGGLILSGIGVIALYLAAIYDELKARPTYVIRRPRDML
jgi:dolichol-phosphate mannosyltransferase